MCNTVRPRAGFSGNFAITVAVSSMWSSGVLIIRTLLSGRESSCVADSGRVRRPSIVAAFFARAARRATTASTSYPDRDSARASAAPRRPAPITETVGRLRLSLGAFGIRCGKVGRKRRLCRSFGDYWTIMRTVSPLSKCNLLRSRNRSASRTAS